MECITPPRRGPNPPQLRGVMAAAVRSMWLQGHPSQEAACVRAHVGSHHSSSVIQVASEGVHSRQQVEFAGHDCASHGISVNSKQC